MRRMLVTGGLGFIGSGFILHMLERHPRCRIYNLDLETYAGNRDNLREVESAPNYTFIKGDIADQLLVETVMREGIDTVVHFAAESHVDRSIDNPGQFVYTNVLGTYHLLEAARRAGVERFVHVSTDEVYGSLGPEGLFTELTPLAPNSPYSASKASSDMLVRAYYHTFGMPALITRCSNNYGPRQYPEKFIPLIITHAMQDKPIPLYGDGRNIRDWLFVEDHCRGIEMAVHNGKPGDTYNIGGNNEHANIEIVRRILQEMGKPLSLIEYVRDRPGHDRRYAIDSSYIRRTLGWSPVYSFDQGLKLTIEWYMANKAWWTKLSGDRDGGGNGSSGSGPKGRPGLGGSRSGPSGSGAEGSAAEGMQNAAGSEGREHP